MRRYLTDSRRFARTSKGSPLRKYYRHVYHWRSGKVRLQDGPVARRTTARVSRWPSEFKGHKQH